MTLLRVSRGSVEGQYFVETRLLQKKVTAFYQNCPESLYKAVFFTRAQISNNLGVNASTKRLSNLAVSDLLAEDEFLVDRDAYRYLQRYVYKKVSYTVTVGVCISAPYKMSVGVVIKELQAFTHYLIYREVFVQFGNESLQ